MLAPEKMERLRAFLATLPGETAGRLARALEADRAAGGRDLPHAQILEALRPRLSSAMTVRFAMLDSHIAALRAARGSDFDAEELVAGIRRCLSLMESVAVEAEILQEAKWVRRLAEVRGALTQSVAFLLERAPLEILGALPPAKVGGFGFGPRPLDFSKDPDPDKHGRALRYGTLLAAGRSLQEDADIADDFERALAKTAQRLKRAAEDLLRETRGRGGKNTAQAERHLAAAMPLFTLVLGEKEAEELRRRAQLPAEA